RLVERLFCGPDAAERDDRTVVVEGGHGLDEAAALVADSVLRRHAYGVEEKRAALGEALPRRAVDAARDTRRVERHEDRADAARAFAAHAGEDDRGVGHAREGDRRLLAAHDVRVALAHGSRRERGGIGSGTR